MEENDFFEEDEFLENDDYVEQPEQNNSQLVDQQAETQNTIEPNSNVSGQEDDLTLDVLKALGISDPEKIQFVDDSGAVIERSWDSLSRHEQLAVLTQHEDLETSLDDDEIMLINNIRNSKLTPSQYIDQLNQQYLNQNSQIQETSQVDLMDDDYLYVLDLMDKVGEENITDEELEEALKNAKANEALFKKTVDGLREQYKNKEQEVIFQQQELQKAAMAQRYNNFVNTVTNSIDSFNYLADQEIELTPDDKEDLADYLLTLDSNGMSKFGIDMNNPNNMIQAAFFLKKGPEILGELSKQIQEAFKRGYAKAKQDIENKSTIVINPNFGKPKTSQDFFDADNDYWD